MVGTAAGEPTTLARVVEHEDNSFNAVRLGAAIAVIVSHSCALLYGEVVGEPLSGVTPYTLGQHAVNVFFVLSSVMLSRSWSRTPDLRRFACARALRIYPALAACGVVVALLIAPFGTDDPRAYVSSWEPYTYPLRILVAFSRAKIEGVFPSGSLAPGEIDYPLWTIKYEIAAYVGFAVLACVGLIRRRIWISGLAIVSVMSVVSIDALALDGTIASLAPIGRFAMSFALGIAAYTFRSNLRLSWIGLAGLLAAAIALRGTPVEKAAYIVLAAYGALCIGAARPPRALRWTLRRDLSYGLYLYAWPVQQLILFRLGPTSLVFNIAATIVGAGLLAFWSWHTIEAPALRLKERASRLFATSPNARTGRRRLWLATAGTTAGTLAVLMGACCLADIRILGIEFC